MSAATATTPGEVIRPNPACDAHVPCPGPDPMKECPGKPCYDDDGTLLCPRGRHRMLGDNRYKNTARCRECKNEDGRKYDPKRAGTGKPVIVRSGQTLTVPPVDPAKVVLPPVSTSYISRDLAGVPDIEALCKLRAAGAFVNLYGPAGTGKTALIEAAFPGVITVNGDGDITTSDVLGQWVPTGDKDQPFIWSHGPLAVAMQLGVPVFFDDITLIPAPILAALYPAMDGRNFVVLKSHPLPGDNGEMAPEIIHGAEGFYIIAAHNPKVYGGYYPGPLKSRFHMHIEVTSDFRVAEKMGIDERAIKLARNLNTALQADRVRQAPQIRQLTNYHLIQQTLGDDAALRNLVGEVLDDDMPHVLAEVQAIFGKRNVQRLALGKDKK